MARRRHTPEQIVRKLKEADRMLNEGPTWRRSPPLPGDRDDLSPLAEPVRRDEGRRRQAPEGAGEGEPALKRMVADKELENLALREIASGKW